jgi:hypothetical protein
MRRLFTIAATAMIPAIASAQQAGSTVTPSAPSRPSLTSEQQVAAATLALPAELRPAATVLGYDAAGKLGQLRAGTNGMICLAPNPAVPRFQSACYHESLEPFMARGRELRAGGVTGDKVDTVRFAEAKAGTLALPKGPAVLYQLFGAAGSYDPATNTVKDGSPLYVGYMPWATAESTGLQAKPAQGTPWLMFPGTPKAHIMFTPRM